ncbi:carbonic anhydrase [Halovulum dunhuangense]|uniref:Carbonic anhydrase n=1 Tax=Halovulum dunhuangense TaxID=1505036 RepID=A0A849KUZ2_9RHOB|nr:carbonic anhydrase [Halovulum dunhuangense]NNU79168.1 carbonic anhydrase [Halovulum dunhuangense]
MPLPARPLPKFLVQRYKGWKATDFEENHSWYKRLADEGQRPRAMVVSCCDSRVHVTSIFGADMGEFFIHRNIASLIPPYNPDGDLHGTSAAIEYAVRVLRVSHLLVLGHSNCGGVDACDGMCRGEAAELEEPTSFVGRWLDLLRGEHAAVAGMNDKPARLQALEKAAVLVSLRNVLTFPYVSDGVDSGDLALHGLWNDIGTGALEHYDAYLDKFLHV